VTVGLGGGSTDARERDPMGKAALFSGSTQSQGMLGRFCVECSACRRESTVRLRELPRLLLPLPVTLPKRHHTLMRCPACGRRTWMRARWRI
jgi:uncharacterized protein with PIN domain